MQLVARFEEQENVGARSYLRGNARVVLVPFGGAFWNL